MILWGIPVMIDLLAKGGGSKGTLTQSQDIIAPQKPVFSALPEATNSAQIVVGGYTEADASVELFLNEIKEDVKKADFEGKFRFEPKLIEGENEVYVIARDEAGNENRSDIYQLIFDNNSLEMTIESPNDEQEFFGINGQTATITGNLNKADSKLSVNGLFVGLDEDGKFVTKVKLTEGENLVKFKASDKAGNTTEKEIKLFYRR